MGADGSAAVGSPARPGALRRWRDALLGGQLRRAVLVLAGGTAIAQLVVAAATPVISRLYSPAEFGAAAAGTGLIGLVLMVSCLTYDHAVAVPREEEVALDLTALAALAAVATSALTGVVLLVAGDSILHAFDAEALAPYAWLLVLGQLAGGLTLALSGWAIRVRAFRPLAGSRVGQSVALVATQVGAGVAGAASAGLVLGDTLGKATAAGRLGWRTFGADLRRLARRPRRSLLATARRYRHFPLVGTWPNLINAIGLGAPVLLMAMLYDARVGGLYALAERLVAAPTSLVILSISQVFVAEAAEVARADPAGLRPLFRATFRRLARLGLPVMALIPLLALLLVGPVFGERWSDAGLYMALLTPLYLAQLVSSPFGGALDVLERQDLLLVRELVRAALLATAVVTAWLLGLPPVGAVILISLAGTLAYALYGAISWHAVRLAAPAP